MRRLVFAGLFALTFGCSRSQADPAAAPEPKPTTSAAPLVLASGTRVVKATAGTDAAATIRGHAEQARADGREIVVYVGAKWCEPCQRFHHAVEKGELDDEFPHLTLVEFDLDVDGPQLRAAGYRSQYIPLFARPNADGRASGQQFEGSIKGEGAVRNIAPRLRTLLSGG